MVILYLDLSRLSILFLDFLEFFLDFLRGDIMFWDVFNDLCQKNNVKPNTVTKSIGLSSATATNWKTSGRIPSGDALIKIAEYFNVSIDYLLGIDQKKPPQSGGADEEYEALTDSEKKIIDILRQLPAEAQARILEFAEFLASKHE